MARAQERRKGGEGGEGGGKGSRRGDKHAIASACLSRPKLTGKIEPRTFPSILFGEDDLDFGLDFSSTSRLSSFALPLLVKLTRQVPARRDRLTVEGLPEVARWSSSARFGDEACADRGDGLEQEPSARGDWRPEGRIMLLLVQERREEVKVVQEQKVAGGS